MEMVENVANSEGFKLYNKETDMIYGFLFVLEANEQVGCIFLSCKQKQTTLVILISNIQQNYK